MLINNSEASFEGSRQVILAVAAQAGCVAGGCGWSVKAANGREVPARASGKAGKQSKQSNASRVRCYRTAVSDGTVYATSLAVPPTYA